MLTPEQLEQLPNNLVRLYAQLEEDILASMAARINATNLFIPATEWQFQKLAEMHNSYDDILKRLSDASGKTETELRELMQTAASESLKYDDTIHRAAGKSLPPLNQSAALLATLHAGIKRTNGYFENLCRTTANQGSKQFANVLDRAYMQVVSGAFTKEQAIQMAVKDLASQGIHAAQYKNGRSMSLEAAVRMNVVTGVNQTCAQLQLERADEAGCDLVEVSAHAGARPDHELWQGKLYSRSGKYPEYPDFVSSTGYGTVTGLCGANCRHNFYPFYEGISKRAYTEKELEQMKARTVPYNGRMLTEYEASQVQRKIERNIRRWKREKAGMKAAGQSTAEAAAKLKYWRREMESFTRQTGFKRQYSREEIFAGKTLQKNNAKGSAETRTSGKSGLKVFTEDELRKATKDINSKVSRYTKKESKWTGAIEFTSNNSFGMGWDGVLRTANETAEAIIVHELLHARSITRYNAIVYAENRNMEEAAVQLFTQEICRKEEYAIIESGYDEMVDKLVEVQEKIGYNKEKFAADLFEQEPANRSEWLLQQARKKNLTIGELSEVQRLVEEIEGMKL